MLVLVLAGPTQAAGEPGPTAAAAAVVALPSGPGAVSDAAATWEVDAFSGQAAASIAIPLPSGPAGFGPSLSLTYDGGLGNGPVGIGWSIAVPRVHRSVREGLPDYDGPADAGWELTALGSGGRLVPVATASLRVEGASSGLRLRRLTAGFRATSTDGTVHWFDLPQADPADPSRVFAWYPSQTEHLSGQTIEWSYLDTGARLLLEGLEWGPIVSCPDGTSGPAFRVELTYGLRPDITVSLRPGFRTELDRRLESVTVVSHCEVLRTLNLTYDDVDVPVSRLASAQWTGRGGSGSLPPTTFTYGSDATPGVLAVESGGWALGQRGVTLLDVDGDGLDDLARFEFGARSWRKNLGGSFDAAVDLPGGDLRHLDDIRLVDLDGDARPEMVYEAGNAWRVHRLADNAFELVGDWPGTDALPLHDGRGLLTDVDGDRRIDLLRATPGGVRLHRGTADTLLPSVKRDPLLPLDPYLEPADDRLRLTDMNGDGLADVVWLGNTRLHVHLGRGDGTFEDSDPRDYPWSEPGVDPVLMRLADLNRDGLVDLIRVGVSHVFWWAATPGGFSATLAGSLEQPAGVQAEATVAISDLDGDGASDIVWSSSDGTWALDLAGPESQATLRTIDTGTGGTTSFTYTTTALLAAAAHLAGEPWDEHSPVNTPVVLTTTRHAGAPTDPLERQCTLFQDALWDPVDRRFGGFLRTWAIQPDTDAPPEAPCRTLTDASILETAYHPGRDDSRVLRGRPWYQLVYDGTGRVYQETLHVLDALSNPSLPTDPLLRVPVTRRTVVETYEGEATPITTMTTFDHDDEGNVIEEHRAGRVDDPLDDVTVQTTYASSPATGVRHVPCEQHLLDHLGAQVSYTRTHFDGDTNPLAPCTLTNGWPRRTEVWLDDATTPRWLTLTETDYDTLGNPVRLKEGRVERTVVYDALDLHPIEERSTPDGSLWLVWKATWDLVLGVPTSVEDRGQVEHAMTYDTLGRPTQLLTDLDGDDELDEPLRTWTYFHDAEHAPTPHTLVTRHEHGAGALSDPVEANVLDGLGRPRYSAFRTDGLQTGAGDWTVQELRTRDRRGRTTAVYRPFEHTGDPESAQVPQTTPFTVLYDAVDRPTTQRSPRSDPSTGQPYERTTAYSLAPTSPAVLRTTQTSDGLAAVHHDTDAFDRPVHTERTINGTVETVDATYTAPGQVAGFTLQAGTSDETAHSFTWDTAGRLLTAADPDIGLRTHTWTDDGLLETTTNAASETVTYTWDDLGRLLERSGTAGLLETVHTYEYDLAATDAPSPAPSDCATTAAVGRPTAVRTEESYNSGPLTPVTVTHTCYDSLGRPAVTSQTISHGASATTLVRTDTLSPSGVPLSIQLATGDGEQRLELLQSYDAAGRLSQLTLRDDDVAQTLLPIWELLGQTPAGEPLAELHGNGLQLSNQRDSTGLATRVRVAPEPTDPSETWTANGALYDVSLARNAYGAVTEVFEEPATSGVYDRDATFRYDPAGRLVEAGVAGYEFDFGYDALQNMTSRTVTVPASAPVFAVEEGGYTHTGRQLTYTADAKYGWDDAGRMATRTELASPFTVTHTLTWDAFDRLREVELPAETLAYAYGPDGTRVSREDSGGAWELQFGEDARVTPGDELQVYLRVGTSAVARADVSLVAGEEDDPPELTFLHTTFGPGPTLLTNDDGTDISERFYTPFGQQIASWTDVQTAWAEEPLGWVNKPHDAETGWSDHGARWLAVQTARWTAPDPPVKGPDAGFVGRFWDLNPYMYAKQNPVVFWDPDGRASLLGAEHAMAAIARREAWAQALGSDGAMSVADLGTLHGIARHYARDFSESNMASEGAKRDELVAAGLIEVTKDGYRSTVTRLAFQRGLVRSSSDLKQFLAAANMGQRSAELDGPLSFLEIAGVTRAAGLLKARGVAAKARIGSGKFEYMFGRAKGAKNAAHNAPRTAQNLQQIRRLGVPDNAQGRAMLQSHFDDVVGDPSNVTRSWTSKHGSFETRESLFAGPGGFAKFESTWEVMGDGTRRLTTVIPTGGP